jgi:hypothetical protein
MNNNIPLHTYTDYLAYHTALANQLGGVGRADAAIAKALDVTVGAVIQYRARKRIVRLNLMAIRCAIYEGALPRL